jgi:hypothetical protein
MADTWITPKWVVDVVHEFWPGGPDLDPCGHPTSLVGAKRQLLLENNEDGLNFNWRDEAETVFVNPPYSDPGPWAEQCAWMGSVGCDVLLLVNGDWTPQWFREAIRSCTKLCMLNRRVKFLDAGVVPKHSARFCNAVIYFGREPARFSEVWGKHGMIIRPQVSMICEVRDAAAE